MKAWAVYKKIESEPEPVLLALFTAEMRAQAYIKMRTKLTGELENKFSIKAAWLPQVTLY
jgi:hypothetical protein